MPRPRLQRVRTQQLAEHGLPQTRQFKHAKLCRDDAKNHRTTVWADFQSQHTLRKSPFKVMPPASLPHTCRRDYA